MTFAKTLIAIERHTLSLKGSVYELEQHKQEQRFCTRMNFLIDYGFVIDRSTSPGIQRPFVIPLLPRALAT
jgi:hypothetical protein